MTSLLTTGDIAKQLGVHRQCVIYALERSGIRERSRAGIVRLLDANQVPAIQAAVEAIREKRGARGSKSSRRDSN